VFNQLKKFVKNSFFKETINILFIHISKRKSAKLLAKFISYQFKLNQIRSDQSMISRKDNYFLGFLKQSIKLLMTTEISRITGVKITIKGRFNKAPRAKKVIMQFGKFTLQSLSSKIDYYQSTAYTVNGTFGVKI
jgi:ribosomal protein S3